MRQLPPVGQVPHRIAPNVFHEPQLVHEGMAGGPPRQSPESARALPAVSRRRRTPSVGGASHRCPDRARAIRRKTTEDAMGRCLPHWPWNLSATEIAYANQARPAHLVATVGQVPDLSSAVGAKLARSGTCPSPNSSTSGGQRLVSTLRRRTQPAGVAIRGHAEVESVCAPSGCKCEVILAGAHSAGR
jgi:hypothetical protein